MTPEVFGLFTALRLLPQYAAHLHFGALDGMCYMVPHHEAQGEHDDVRRLKATVMTGVALISILAALVLLPLDSPAVLMLTGDKPRVYHPLREAGISVPRHVVIDCQDLAAPMPS